jgi:pimeloyl-ACP methyl ester carboxylesterase
MDDPAVLKAMHRSNRMAFMLARRAPLVLHVVFGIAAFVAKRWPDKAAGANSKQMPAADREILSDTELMGMLRKEAPEPFRHGVRGVVDEAVLFANPWGFRLEDVSVPVLLWHGSEDRNAPLQMAKEMERRIPDCTATYYEGAGHLYFFRKWPEIAAALKG